MRMPHITRDRHGGIDWCMAPWRRRKGKKDARRETALREHVEAMWAVACTLTGDETTAVEVVKEVVRGTLPRPHRLRQRGLRLEVVIAATDAAAARVFSPLDRRLRTGAYAAALGPQASALRRAFSRRVSWDVQALLWATDVEEIAESDVVHRLGQTHPDREAGRLALRLAYLDLRRDLDSSCRAALRDLFGLAAGPEQRAGDSHLGSCAVCQAETRWLSDLGSALRSVPPAMPPDVWAEARRIFRGSDNVTPAISSQLRPSATDSRRRAVVVVSATDQTKAALGDATIATNGCEPTFVCPVVDAEEPDAHRLVGRVVLR